MLFNSYDFLLFFPTVVAAYFLLPDRFRWMFLLGASYYFYMCWKAEYIVLILLSTVIDYVAALQMSRSENPVRRKSLLVLSLCANLGVLFSFKYANFFGDSINGLLNQFNIAAGVPYLDVLLPVGISFYTFQSMSYSIDVYRGEKEAETHFGKFALYVSFFPQLVAGPIERSTRLLPQFHRAVHFDWERVVSGLRLMLWGFFKKLVIADRLAIYVNEAYNQPGEVTGAALLLATYFFAFQIYCDFSGYSDIAIGTARILGFDLMNNFRQPYFSRSISEFWGRWHISLSTWFRDYLYIPLGGNRVSKQRWYVNLMAVFLISGLWHGANWTFFWWGFLHGLYLIWALVSQSYRDRFKSRMGIGATSWLNKGLQIFVTFNLVCLAWVFFRANSIQDAFYILQTIAQTDWLSIRPRDINIALGWGELLLAFAAIGFMEAVHITQATGKLEQLFTPARRSLRWAVYYTLILSILFFGVFNRSEFIYFQF
ncbi:MAG: MBOAT family O-acyltransferase [Calditrichia bacterium]